MIGASLLRLRERLRKAVSHTAFFPVLRRLERDLTPIGTHASADDERIRFSHPPTYTLGGGEILDVEVAEASGKTSVTVSTSLLGLLGSESPLPPWMSEDVLFDDDGVLAAFYDVFHDRALALLYRAWKRYDPSMALERAGANGFSQAVLALVGVDAFSPYPPEAASYSTFALGLSDFARCEPAYLDVDALEQLLRRVSPELSPRVTMGAPRLVLANDEDRTCLGAQRSTLGEDAGWGASAFDPCGVVRIHVGPVDRETYESLLPTGALYGRLEPLVSAWLGSRAEAELEVALPVDAAPALCLGEAYGGALGIDAQYRDGDAREVRARIPLRPGASEDNLCFSDDGDDAEPTHAPPLSAGVPDAGPAAPTIWRAALKLLLHRPLPTAVERAMKLGSRVAAAGRADAALDMVIAAIDARIGAQVDVVLHAPALQALEARWRGLDYLVNRVAFDENIELSVLDSSKEDLVADFAESTEIVRSRTFSTIYTGEMGTFGGAPYAAILADFDLDASARDVQLARQLAAVASTAHAPLFASASPSLLQLGSWRDLPQMRALPAVFEGPSRAAWNALRDVPDSRALGLLVGRPLHRAPYGAGTETPFVFTESIAADGEGLLFGSPIYVFASRLAASFARYRTLAAIAGDEGDSCLAPAALPVPSLGPRHARPPLEVSITPRLEQQLRDVGLIGLVHRPDAPQILLASANSVQRSRTFGSGDGGPEASLNDLLGTKLPYFFLACRFAHYVKVLEREMTGAHRTAEEVQEALNAWLSQYVLQMSSASASLRAQYPLREARVLVAEVADEAGWHRGEIRIRPHLRYLDRFFTLLVTNWIPRKPGAVLPGIPR